MTGPVRMSDQALVVVGLARRSAGAEGATAAHLLAAAAAEPEGGAGVLLRARQSAAGALAERLGWRAQDLPALGAVVDVAARRAAPRPVDTLDLLQAALDSAGPAAAGVLEACGYDVERLALDVASAAEDRHDPQRRRETLGYPPQGRHPDLTPAAARVVAKVRAVAGGAVDVLLALTAADDEPVFSTAEAEAVQAAAWRVRKRGEDRAAGWDAGLEAVTDAAGVVRAGERATCLDLLRAALLAGGQGPSRVLQEARRATG